MTFGTRVSGAAPQRNKTAHVKHYLAGAGIAPPQPEDGISGSGVMDKIDQIVERAIAYTEEILARAPQFLDVAREGLERMRDNLAAGAPDHGALKRLDDYIKDLANRSRPGSLH